MPLFCSNVGSWKCGLCVYGSRAGQDCFKWNVYKFLGRFALARLNAEEFKNWQTAGLEKFIRREFCRLTVKFFQERDLILAAELGKALLEKNEDLSKQNEKIAEDFSQKLEVCR